MKPRCSKCGMPVERRFHGSQGDGRNLERWCTVCGKKTYVNETVADPAEAVDLLTATMDRLLTEIELRMKVMNDALGIRDCSKDEPKKEDPVSTEGK